MSLQNEMRRTQKINLEFKAKRLRGEIENLARIICVNLDCSLHRPEDLPVSEVDSQWDELKDKWAALSICLTEIKKLEEELK
ncbi:MAG: hypothetical protein WC637_00475 [Victivallales bacterium]|jgi:hypothetical protein